MENKLSSVLSNVQGAGKVSVMVTLECGIEYIYAFIGKNEKGATVVMKPDMMEEAQKLLSSNGFEIVSGEELYK